jgi:hemoglobin
MSAAVASATSDLDDGDAVAAELLVYFFNTAEHMRNDTGLPITSPTFRA